MSDSNSRLVYSTETGRIADEKRKVERPKGDGIVRIRRETSGRKGKGVCVVTGLDLEDSELAKLAADLKRNVAVAGLSKMVTLKFKAINAMLSNSTLRRKVFKSS
ncbi:translation initiation factor Sui1 [Providencia rettgeri Dmel1]|nr:translation initiation factor Sui1 [Providencia rettgeri Dmel1]